MREETESQESEVYDCGGFEGGGGGGGGPRRAVAAQVTPLPATFSPLAFQLWQRFFSFT